MQGKKILNWWEAARAGGKFPHTFMLTNQHLHVVIWKTRADKWVPPICWMSKLQSQSHSYTGHFSPHHTLRMISLLFSLHNQKSFSQRKLSDLPRSLNPWSLEYLMVDSKSSDSRSFLCTVLFPSRYPIFYILPLSNSWAADFHIFNNFRAFFWILR